nr:hypothetical protein [Tanacetum cinerariifolium]
MYEFIECSSCEALYTKSCACSKGGFVDKFVCDHNKTTDSSQRPSYDCPRCGSPVDGLYCRHCALLRKKITKVWSIICDEHEFFQDFLNTFESSNDDSNVVNAPQESIIFNQEPGENSSQIPPHIDHQCCYGCGDSLDGIFYQEENSFAHESTPNLVNDSPNIFNPPSQPSMYVHEFCGNDAQYGHDCPPQDVSSLVTTTKDQVCHKIPLSFDDDDDEESSTPLRDIIIFELPPCIAITHVLSTTNSLIMGDEHLDTILEKESGEFIKSSVENIISNLSESEDERECDVPICDDFTTFSNLLFDADDDLSSSKDESFFDEDMPKEIYSNLLFDEDIISIMIDPHHLNAEDILILEELLSNDSFSLPENKSFHFDIPSSPHPHAKPPDDDEIEPNSRIFTVKVVGDISEHYVPMPRLFPTRPTLASNQEKSSHLLSHQGLKAF